MFTRAVLAASILLAPAAAAPKFSLWQILGAPFPSDLTASPVGAKFAWVMNERGARNIWIAAPPDYRGHRLTSYADDDGQEIAQLRWTPDGAAIVYTRGGDFEFNAADPNPASLAAGVEQDIFMVSVSGGGPRKVAAGNSPAVSPDGARIAFLKKGQIYSAGLAPDVAHPAAPEMLVHVRGEADSLRWSPDGKALAFVSARGDHSFIALYEPGAKAVRYLDPSTDRDSQPAWSPDSRRIAFLRIPVSHSAFAFGPKRSAEPWSIRIAAADTGEGRELWRAKEGAGSAFHAMVAESQLLWAAGNRIVFPWEAGGWLHLESVSADSGAVAALNGAGEFEVEHVALGAGGQDVLFSSNEGDIDRRHLWRVPAAGGKAAPVTSGAGIEWSPAVSSDGKAIALFASTATVPAHAAILKDGGAMADLAPGSIPPDFPSASLATPQQVIFSSADGLAIHGQLFLPPDLAPGARHPAVIFFHGGSRRQMLLGWHPMGYYHNAYALNQYLASSGFVVLSVNYRSGIGYGLNFREALNYGATGASEFNDVQGAGVFLRGRADVDAARIGLWGGSYGGYLTALGLARASDLFAAGVDFHGVHDWNLEISNFVPAYDPKANQDAARVAFTSSPLASVDTWRSPVLLIQGDDDRNVPFEETTRLVEALRKRHVDVEQLVFPDEIHDFLTWRRWVQAYEATAAFLERKLKP